MTDLGDVCENEERINLLTPELIFLILAHPVYEM